jgi:hypothetical protein
MVFSLTYSFQVRFAWRCIACANTCTLLQSITQYDTMSNSIRLAFLSRERPVTYLYQPNEAGRSLIQYRICLWNPAQCCHALEDPMTCSHLRSPHCPAHVLARHSAPHSTTPCHLTHDRCQSTSTVRFSKSSAPYIRIQGAYVHCMPFVSLHPAALKSLNLIMSRLRQSLPRDRPLEVLFPNQGTAIHQLLGLISIARHAAIPTPEDCRVFHETIADNWTHDGLPVEPVLHVSDVVNRTIWHMPSQPQTPDTPLQDCEGPPQNQTFDIERCSNCLIAKLRKSVGGHAPGYIFTALGQGLAIDGAFMFQCSKTLCETSD